VTGTPVDLRSDTVTRPSPEMREVIAAAEVGDDVFGEDPTVKRLEARVAELLGKEAAVFVPSGVMGNQIAIMVHTRPGDEVILAERSHIFHYESGAPALLSGVQLRPIEHARGLITPEQVEAAIRPEFDWEPRSRLVCLENTVNKAGGAVFPPRQAEAVAETARSRGLRVHLDGARLWNAAVAVGKAESELAAPFDTVSVALSKGLGAPVGSVLAGSREDMRLARRHRKLLGGGMRQVGILAAAGLYAVEHHRQGLTDDHRRARVLAAAMASSPAFSLDAESVETNIVIAETRGISAADAVAALRALGIYMIEFGPTTVRATTHRDVSDSDLDRAVKAIASAFSSAAVA
jgi:threonine aldolase